MTRHLSVIDFDKLSKYYIKKLFKKYCKIAEKVRAGLSLDNALEDFLLEEMLKIISKKIPKGKLYEAISEITTPDRLTGIGKAGKGLSNISFNIYKNKNLGNVFTKYNPKKIEKEISGSPTYKSIKKYCKKFSWIAFRTFASHPLTEVETIRKIKNSLKEKNFLELLVKE